jgi:hypothetical protein
MNMSHTIQRMSFRTIKRRRAANAVRHGRLREVKTTPPTIDKEDEENITYFFEEEQVPTIILDDGSERLAAISPRVELLKWHYLLGHTSFEKIKLMAALDILPRRIATVHPPKCTGCVFGSMTKTPWISKSDPSKVNAIVVTGPGDCVSVDQLEPSTPGFVAQLKGILTKRR